MRVRIRRFPLSLHDYDRGFLVYEHCRRGGTHALHHYSDDTALDGVLVTEPETTPALSNTTRFPPHSVNLICLRDSFGRE